MGSRNGTAKRAVFWPIPDLGGGALSGQNASMFRPPGYIGPRYDRGDTGYHLGCSWAPHILSVPPNNFFFCHSKGSTSVPSPQPSQRGHMGSKNGCFDISRYLRGDLTTFWVLLFLLILLGDLTYSNSPISANPLIPPLVRGSRNVDPKPQKTPAGVF